jgi:hypothetical protein
MGPTFRIEQQQGRLWHAFSSLSLYIEALCIHEWCLFSEGLAAGDDLVDRGRVYYLLTDRPDNRRPLTWERIQIDLMLMEGQTFHCPWTQRALSRQPGGFGGFGTCAATTFACSDSPVDAHAGALHLSPTLDRTTRCMITAQARPGIIIYARNGPLHARGVVGAATEQDPASCPGRLGCPSPRILLCSWQDRDRSPVTCSASTRRSQPTSGSTTICHQPQPIIYYYILNGHGICLPQYYH